MDDIAEGAHRGMTVQMEHTTCEDPVTDEAAVISEFLHLFSLVSDLMVVFLRKSLPHMQLQLTCTYRLYDSN